MTAQTATTQTRSGKNRPHRYSAELADQIERRWQAAWEEHDAFVQPNPGQPGFDASRPKFYCLDMFPYPSGAGLHVGHPEGYTATDIVSRFKRMTGHNVLHPMGWDAFGLPAEQYAIQTGIHPAQTTRKSIDTFRAQLKRFGFSYDWSREFGTIDEDYYKWTQWIFLQIYNAWYDTQANKARPIAELIKLLEGGSHLRADLQKKLSTFVQQQRSTDSSESCPNWAELTKQEQRAFIDDQRLAYVGEQVVNWCPKLGTALANEEVIDGRSERGGFPVLRQPLKQWMFRITSYAQRLLDGLADVHWPESTRTMQTEWIGRSEGAEVDFPACGGTALRAVSPAVSTIKLPLLKPAGFVGRDPYPPGEPSPGDLIGHIRHLPHYEMDGATYFVTWRTRNGKTLSPEDRETVLAALEHWDGRRCQVYAACVMPDHVHWILCPYDDFNLSDLVASVKKYSSRIIHKAKGAQGHLWQDERFDHIIRDEAWFTEFIKYVISNPVEAGLADKPSSYPFTRVHPDVGGSVAADTASDSSESCPTSLRVYTTRPDTIFGATYMVVAPEHPLVESVLANPTIETDVSTLRTYVEAARNRSDVERQESKEKTGVFTGVYCINPAIDPDNPLWPNQQRIPVWVADYVLIGYGHGAIMAVPSHDQRDFEFARKFEIPTQTVVMPDDKWLSEHVGQPMSAEMSPEELRKLYHTTDAYFGEETFAGEGVSINSDNADVSLNGLATPDAKARIIDWLESKGLGQRTVNFKLRDWLFSRQRYWGEPFPIVWDEEGHHHAVGENTLPLTLPPLTDYAPEESDEPKPLLAKAHDWVETTAAIAGVKEGPWGLPADARVTRETNTMPGWAGSCWYFLRYCDNTNANTFIGDDAQNYWMGDNGVDLYIGGAEHAVLHLLYARFWHKVLFDLGKVSTHEPFPRLFHQGLITSFAYQREDKSLVPVDEVEEVAEDSFVESATGKPVFQTTAKMSKSLKNVVNPDDVIAEFGADTFRLYEMYIGPLEASAPWNPRDIIGLFRFLQRAWRVMVDEDTGDLLTTDTPSDDIEKQLHRTIAKVESDIERLSFNTAIAAMIEFTNAASNAGRLSTDQIDRFVRTLAPFAPHFCEAVWSKLGRDGYISHADWPAFDDAMLRDDEIEIPVQILGKVRSKITVPADADKDALEKAALADSKIASLIEGKTVRKIVVVPGRMVNIVAN